MRIKNPLSTTQDLQDYNTAIVNQDVETATELQKKIVKKSAVRLTLTVVAVAAATYVAAKLAEADDTEEE